MPMRSTGNNLLKVRARALTALMLPLRLRLSEWDRKNIRLPEGVSALSGAVRLWSRRQNHEERNRRGS